MTIDTITFTDLGDRKQGVALISAVQAKLAELEHLGLSFSITSAVSGVDGKSASLTIQIGLGADPIEARLASDWRAAAAAFGLNPNAVGLEFRDQSGTTYMIVGFERKKKSTRPFVIRRTDSPGKFLLSTFEQLRAACPAAFAG